MLLCATHGFGLGFDDEIEHDATLFVSFGGQFLGATDVFGVIVERGDADLLSLGVEEVEVEGLRSDSEYARGAQKQSLCAVITSQTISKWGRRGESAAPRGKEGGD